MKSSITIKSVTLAGLLLALNATAGASPAFPTLAAENEIAACVEEVAQGADYSGASSVHHDVESSEHRRVGHKLVIDTKVIGAGGVLREYRAVCVVVRGKQPKSFRMREIRASN